MPTASDTQHASSVATWAAHFGHPSGRRRWPCEALVRALAGKRFGTAVEAGCGDGANLQLLAEHSSHAVGVDSCAEALELAAARSDAETRTADFRRLPFGPATVDAVVDVMAGQHLPWGEHRGLYAEYRRVMKAGLGWLFTYHLGSGTSTDREPYAPRTYRGLGLFPAVDAPFALPSRDEIAAVIRAAGFDILSHERVSRDYGDGRVAVYHAVEARAR